MRRFLVCFGLATLAGNLLAEPAAPTADTSPLVPPFSSGRPGAALPSGWTRVVLTDRKKETRYDLVDDQGTVVLHAVAEAAATGLGVHVNFDLRSAPMMSWRWKVAGLIKTADPRATSKEDSPVRIVLEFDGDKSKLGLGDRSVFAFSKGLSGRELPYATLMYVWANQIPAGTVVQNPRTSRVQMIVASSGEGGVGAWQTLTRNVMEDFRKAFNEEPGALMAVGVLTDTDNTGETTEAWYGDIRFLPAR
jgi:hypothetical protein